MKNFIFTMLVMVILGLSSCNNVEEQQWDITYDGWSESYMFGNQQDVHEIVDEFLKTERYKDRDTVYLDIVSSRTGANVKVIAIKKKD